MGVKIFISSDNSSVGRRLEIVAIDFDTSPWISTVRLERMEDDT